MAHLWTVPPPQALSPQQVDRVHVAQVVCSSGSEAIVTPVAAWAAGTDYGAGQYCVYNGDTWFSRVGNNQGNIPVEGAFWTRQIGLNLKNIQGAIAEIDCAAGNTIAAGATLQAYLVSAATGILNRAPGLDWQLTQGNAGEILPGFPIPGPAQRLIMLPNGVGNFACNVILSGVPVSGILQN